MKRTSVRLRSNIWKSEVPDVKFTVKDNFTSKAAQMIADRSNKAEHIVARQAKADTSPYVPFLTGSLDIRTRVVGNTIIYPGPYARYLYYGVKMVDAATGKGPMHFIGKDMNEYIRFRKGATLKPTDEPLKYTTQHHKLAGPAWFERSKAENKDKWLKLAEEVVNNG